MYAIYTLKDTVRVPPSELGKNLKKTILKILQTDIEGLVDEGIGVLVSIFDVEKVGEGKVIPGDGAAYYETTFKALGYKPEMHEVVEGLVSEITEFGAFIKTGPVEGLVHVSQIMNDYINYDAKSHSFIGKESKKKLQVDDMVLARTVTISLKGSIQSSKIGFTMRQPGLGKKEWLEADLRKKEKKDKAVKPVAPKPVRGEAKKK